MWAESKGIDRIAMNTIVRFEKYVTVVEHDREIISWRGVTAANRSVALQFDLLLTGRQQPFH